MKKQWLFEQIDKYGHEQVFFCQDKAVGFKSIIALHNTVLGSALGGVRMWPYKDENDALADVLRLSRGMTYKSSLAGLNLGGGKAVIIGDPAQKNEALLRRFGVFVNSLGGQYWTAEDVNITVQDIDYVRMETPYVCGAAAEGGGAGDPSPMTAYGVFIAMKAAALKVYGSEDLASKRVVIQGVGHVGTNLTALLIKANAEVSICDVNEKRLHTLKQKYPQVTVISNEKVFEIEADIFAPCALGGILDKNSIPKLKYKIIAGAANNQLAEDQDVHLLAKRGVLYLPDFMINAGGVIHIYYEYSKRANNTDMSMRHIDRTYQTIIDVLQHAENHNITPHEAAMYMAEKRVQDIAKIRGTRFTS